MDAATWYGFGRALGLTPCVAHDTFSIDRSFAHLRGVTDADDATCEAPSAQHWFSGYRDEIEVFVLPFTSATSGKSYTICVACSESDDPYATFADLGRDTLVRYFTPEVEYGNSICLPYRDAARARGEDVLVGANESRALVARYAEFETLDTLRSDLDVAVALARRVSKIERFVPEEWCRFGDEHALTYDENSLRLSGNIYGGSMDVHLEVRESAPHIVTTIALTFPSTLPIESARIEAANHAGFFQSLLLQDITIGTEPIDAKYRMTGRPTEAVRALLREDVWRAALHLPGLGQIELGPTSATWKFAGCPPRASELAIVAACADTANVRDAQRPYR